MRRFFVVFIFFFYFLPGFPEISSCPGKEEILSPQKNDLPPVSRAAKQPRQRFFLLQQERSSRSILFASRLRVLLRNLFQERLPANPRCIFLPARHPVKKGENALKITLRDGRIYFTLPTNFSLLYHDRNTLYKMVSLSLLATESLPLDREKEFRSSWLVAGIVHNCLDHLFLSAMPYSDYTPAALVFARYGIFPELKDLLTIPIPPESSFADFYGEYSSLLLAGLLRNRFFSGEDFSSVIRKTLEKGVSSQYEVLYAHLENTLQKRKRKLTISQWFDVCIKRELATSLLPASPHWVEKEYLKTAVLSGKDRSGKIVTFPVTQLFTAVKTLSEPDKEVFRLLRDLHILARTAPDSVRTKLLALRLVIIKTRRDPVKENQDLLNKTEQQLFAELDKANRMEEFLRSTELFATTPGTRFFQTLKTTNKTVLSPLGSRLEILLENTAKTYLTDDRGS